MGKKIALGGITGILVLVIGLLVNYGCSSGSHAEVREQPGFDEQIQSNAERLLEEGKQAYRFETFGNEAFWGGNLRLHEAILGEELGGVGPGVSPNAALAVGLKVDADALPQELKNQLAAGLVDLDSPETTIELLRLNAVVGVTGFFDENDNLNSMGIQCALCHSVVDDSFARGIGRRLDGWAPRDLNVGAIIAMAPDLSVFATLLGVDEATVREVLLSWGPGKYDAALVFDGKTTGPQGPAATLLPPAFGLAGVNFHTFTGWGSVTYWNASVAVLQMQSQGTFFDPRLNDAEKFPIAAREGFADVRRTPDLVTPKLAALHFYQLAIPAPQPPPGSFDPDAAERGEAIFNGRGDCARCHVPPLFLEPGWNLHTAEEIGIDDFQAMRSPTERYRTAPLKGLWSHTEGGFYHDGRFATLLDVIEHYDIHFSLGLTEMEKDDLVEYLMSL